jgi:hypothetical protein
MIWFFLPLVIFYTIYTLTFALKFNDADTHFTENQKLFHNILIWLIPFFWIMVLKTVMRPVPGESRKTKGHSRFYESGIGILGHHGIHHNSDGESHDGGGD